jgi:hypothetical protein
MAMVYLATVLVAFVGFAKLFLGLTRGEMRSDYERLPKEQRVAYWIVAFNILVALSALWPIVLGALIVSVVWWRLRPPR